MASLNVNDSGVIFSITVKDESGVVNLTTVTSIPIFFQKPNKQVIQRTCNITDATKGLVSYTSQTNDFDQAGSWKVQIVVRFANGNVKHSDVGSFTVGGNISFI